MLISIIRYGEELTTFLNSTNSLSKIRSAHLSPFYYWFSCVEVYEFVLVARIS